jgi:enoyl-CoA hydratase/3-hydroxyacyl-CoA dehydrogenase
MGGPSAWHQDPVPEDVRKKVRDRLLGILFSQCFDISDRGIGTKEDLNFGCQVGLGFRKGPFDIMRDLGEGEVKRIVDNYAKERPGFPQPKNPLPSYQDFKRYLLVDDVDGVKIITIRRPEAMNALNEDIMKEILAVLKENADKPEVKGFVITGYGNRAFSAGADIGQFPSTLGNREAAAKLARENSTLLVYMDQTTKPVVAALTNGSRRRIGAGHTVPWHGGAKTGILPVSGNHAGDLTRHRRMCRPLQKMAQGCCPLPRDDLLCQENIGQGCR